MPNAPRATLTSQACQAAGFLAQPAREPEGEGPDYEAKTPDFFLLLLQLAHLRCELLTNPEGIDATAPRLSWELSSARRGLTQTAYQVLVASTPEKLAADEGDLWDSGKIASSQSVHVAYAGAPLRSRTGCY